MKKRILSTFMAAVFGILSVGMVNVSVMAATKNIIDIDLALDDASELTWVASSNVTVSNADGIGGRDNVLEVKGLANSNNNTAGVKFPDGFAFLEGDVLTYSIDVYSGSSINPDMWLRNHDGSLAPFALFGHEALTANTWTTVTNTVTYDEMVSNSISGGSTGAFYTSGNYAFYIRPRSSATAYLDNLKVTVTREVGEKCTVFDVDLPLDATSEITWIASDAVTVSKVDGIGNRNNVIKAEGVANNNNNTVGITLGENFSFREGDVLTYSLDVYSESSINPDMWLRDHADLAPFVTFYSSLITAGTWTTLSKTVTYEELQTSATGWDDEGTYAFYIRPRSSATVYLDNFKVNVSNTQHVYGSWVNVDSENHSRTCRCGEEETEAHTWDDGTITTAPTHTTDGVKIYTCTGCNRNKSETIPAGEEYHTYGVWVKDDDVNHKKTCNCGDELFETHTWDDGVITKEPTHTTDGVKVYTCSVCSGTKTETIPASTEHHTYGDWVTDGDTNHKKICACGSEITEAHSWDNDEVTVVPTHTTAGEKIYACSVCDTTKTEVIPAGTQATSNVISMNLPLDDVSEITWIASEDVTVRAANGIGGRNGVLQVSGLSNSNNNTAGVKLPDGFAFQEDDVLTYSIDVYSTSAINLDLWLRNHANSDLAPFAQFSHSTITTNTWTTVTKTVTYDEMVSLSLSGGSTGAFDTIGNYALYIRPRNGSTVYLDNFKVTVTRMIGEANSEHTYGDYVKVDDEYHKKECDCGVSVTEAHTWGEGEVTSQPTTTTAGVITYTCMVCGATKTESIAAGTPIEEKVVNINLPLDNTSELTWIASDAVTVSAANGIGGRNGVLQVSGLSNSNNNTAGVKLPDGFAFQAGDILTYSLDVYSESAINPDMWLRDHADLVPFVTLYHGTVTTGTWAQITGTFTYDELVQKSIDCGSTGAFDTAGNYAFYIRPRSSATVYLDNFKVTVSREEEPIECEHTYGDWKSIDSVNHSRTCSLCGTVITKAHSWNSGTVTTEPTTTTTGIKTYKCVSCNYTKTEVLDKLVAPSERTTITVGNANSCAGNEVTVPVSISKNTGLTGLSLLIGYDSDALTLIGATKGTALSSLTFTRGQIDANTAILIWDGDAQDSTNGQIVQLVFRVDETASDEYTIEATVKAACDGNSNKVYTNVSAGTVTLKAHSYGSWVENDEETHKKVCAYGHFITESHDWDAGVITTSATCTKEGVKTYTCTVCGDTKTEVIPKDIEAHNFGSWVANGEKVHKKACSCGLYITESHTWDAGVITTQPTTTTAGIKTYECTACLYTKTESFGTRLPTTSDTTVTVGSVTASTGNEITVPVSISNNVGITGLQLTLEYNTNVLTLTGVTRSTALATMEFTQPGDLNQNSLLFMWDGQDADSSNGEILLLTFKVADSAVAGEYQILVDSAIACDQNMNNAPVYLTGGTVSIVTQTPGDVNNDKRVDVRDVMLLRRYVTGGYGVVLNESVANVNKDSRVDVRDVMLLRRYVTGGYGVVLK